MSGEGDSITLLSTGLLSLGLTACRLSGSLTFALLPCLRDFSRDSNPPAGSSFGNITIDTPHEVHVGWRRSSAVRMGHAHLQTLHVAGVPLRDLVVSTSLDALSGGSRNVTIRGDHVAVEALHSLHLDGADIAVGSPGVPSRLTLGSRPPLFLSCFFSLSLSLSLPFFLLGFSVSFSPACCCILSFSFVLFLPLSFFLSLLSCLSLLHPQTPPQTLSLTHSLLSHTLTFSNSLSHSLPSLGHSLSPLFAFHFRCHSTFFP